MIELLKIFYVVAMMFIVPCGLLYMGLNDIVAFIIAVIVIIISFILLFIKDDEFKML